MNNISKPNLPISGKSLCVMCSLQYARSLQWVMRINGITDSVLWWDGCTVVCRNAERIVLIRAHMVHSKCIGGSFVHAMPKRNMSLIYFLIPTKIASAIEKKIVAALWRLCT